MAHILITKIENKVSSKGNDYLSINTITIEDNNKPKCQTYQYYKPDTTLSTNNVYVINYETKPYGNVIKAITPEPNYNKEEFYLTYCSKEQFLNYVEQIQTWIEKLSEPYKSIVKELYTRYGLYDKNPTEHPLLTNTGARVHHHSGKYGLIAHIVEVTQNAINLSNTCFKSINPNLHLVVAGALLHDIGKFDTYQISELGEPQMSPTGEVINHLPYGLAILQTSPYLIQHPTEILKLQEIIQSHHSKIEWGAVATPKTKEAIIVANADLFSYYTEAYKDGVASNQSVINIGDMKIMNGGL